MIFIIISTFLIAYGISMHKKNISHGMFLRFIKERTDKVKSNIYFITAFCIILLSITVAIIFVIFDIYYSSAVICFSVIFSTPFLLLGYHLRRKSKRDSEFREGEVKSANEESINVSKI